MNVCMFLLAVPALVPWPKEASFTDGEVAVSKPVFATDAKLPAEGYRLSVGKGGVKVWASTDAGRFYAGKTLEQLAENGRYPCCEIVDAPAFGYRGFHLDEARHFFGKAEVKKLIEEMSRLKLNRFHWHLTDDQGWRIELKKYPELVQYGATRPQSPVKGPLWQRKKDGVPYGPYFYTEEEIREIVAYAAARHVVIVPEIDLPGHCQGLLAGYPWMLCEGGRLKPRAARDNWWLAGIRTLCIGNDEALAQVEGILEEVMKLFPGEYIHFGGDECPTHYWEKCPKCRARMQAEGLKDGGALQGWFMRRLADWLVRKGRKPIGWNEILGAAVTKDCIVMSWTGTGGGISAARRGNAAIMTPGRWCYLQTWDGNAVTNEWNANRYIPAGVGQTADRVYAFDPTNGVPEKARQYILGGQACLWTEYVFTPEQVEYHFFPRVGAIAESLWTAPAKRDYRTFRTRLEGVAAAQRARGVNVAKIIDNPKFAVVGDWRVSVEWGAERAEFDVPKGAGTRGLKPVVDRWKGEHYAPQRLDWIVRTRDGKFAYRVGKECEKLPPLPALEDGEELAGTVWVPVQALKLTDDNLYPVFGRRFSRPQCRWNEPLVRDACPKTLKKLERGEPLTILFWGDSCLEQVFLPASEHWHLNFLKSLKEMYPKANVRAVVRHWAGYESKDFLEAPSGSPHNFEEQVVAVKPDLVISEFANDSNLPTDGVTTPVQKADATEKVYERIYEAFRSAGAEWVICKPHYLRPDWMGKATVAACDGDPRPFCKMLDRFSRGHKVCLANVAGYWSQLRAQGLPYPALFDNDINHPGAYAMRFYRWALEDVFRPGTLPTEFE